MTPSPSQASHRPTLNSLNTRTNDHEQRIDNLEVRLAKYDVIIERLDTLINVLTQQVSRVDDRAGAAIDGQKLLNERNDGAYRWSTIWIAVATGLIVGILCFVIGYILPR